MALPFPRAAILFFFSLLPIGKRIDGLTEKEKLSVNTFHVFPTERIAVKDGRGIILSFKDEENTVP